MPGSDRVTDKPIKRNDSNNRSNGSDASSSTKILQEQAVGELSGPNNNNAKGAWGDSSTSLARSSQPGDAISALYNNPSLETAYPTLKSLSMTSPYGDTSKENLYAKLLNQDIPKYGGMENTERLSHDIPKYGDPSQNAPKEIKFYSDKEIKFARIIDRINGYSTDLQTAKEDFLIKFKAHGGDVHAAEKYINMMITANHNKAEYSKLHNKKVQYVSDKNMADCINQYTKVIASPDAYKQSGYNRNEVNSRLVGLIKAVSDPTHKLNQGQIGSCALHAGLIYTATKAPQELARIGSKLIRTREYRGHFDNFDMNAASGQDRTSHMLGTAALRCTYKLKHLNSSYGGTDAVNLGKGIKRLTRDKVHAVWSDGKTVSNGADLDITMGGAHCQTSIARVIRQNGKLVLQEKQDNTWSGFRDGAWKTVG